jgi:hypothetical protein
MSDPKIKQRRTFTVRLTKFELLHLRDLFGIVFPQEMKTTVSQALAQSQDRVLIEAKLWQKLAKACYEAELPMDDDAPDFVCAAAGAPPIGIFELAQEPAQEEDGDIDAPGIFAEDDAEDDGEDE